MLIVFKLFLLLFVFFVLPPSLLYPRPPYSFSFPSSFSIPFLLPLPLFLSSPPPALVSLSHFALVLLAVQFLAAVMAKKFDKAQALCDESACAHGVLFSFFCLCSMDESLCGCQFVFGCMQALTQLVLSRPCTRQFWKLSRTMQPFCSFGM